MRVGIVDADLIGREKHRFPNLVCEKLSGYWKQRGTEVDLLLDYDHFDEYDEVYIAKVFTDTSVPEATYENKFNMSEKLPFDRMITVKWLFFCYVFRMLKSWLEA